jgi:hypothetical protein
MWLFTLPTVLLVLAHLIDVVYRYKYPFIDIQLALIVFVGLAAIGYGAVLAVLYTALKAEPSASDLNPFIPVLSWIALPVVLWFIVGDLKRDLLDYGFTRGDEVFVGVCAVYLGFIGYFLGGGK